MPPPRLAGLTKLTLLTAPTVCHECIWWQTRGRRELDKDRWMERVELEFGAWGTVYYDTDRRVLGSMQYGPAAAFPRAWELPAGRWDLILAGHLHGGQIVLPYGFGKLLLAHPGAKYPEGVFERKGTTMHVSPGLGTTFVPFRFFARPEATELVLKCG